MSGGILARNSRAARFGKSIVTGRAFGVSGAAVLVCLILSACGTARPVKYYRIQAAPSSAPSGSSPYPISLLLGQITAPSLFRDDRLVYSNGSVQLGTYNDQRWADAPPEMIGNMLLQSLRASGQYRAVERVSSNARGDYILRGRILAFNEVDTAQIAARFAMDLELFDRKAGSVVWTQSYSHDEPVNEKKVPAVIEAMQTNVRAGLQQLTASLSRYFASQTAH